MRVECGHAGKEYTAKLKYSVSSLKAIRIPYAEVYGHDTIHSGLLPVQIPRVPSPWSPGNDPLY